MAPKSDRKKQPTGTLLIATAKQFSGSTPYLAFARTDGTDGQYDILASTTVGRHTENSLQFLDPEVSKQHLTLDIESGRVRLKDLGSANGTIVNGREVDTTFLEDGDIIVVGNTHLRFCQPSSDENKTTISFDEHMQLPAQQLSALSEHSDGTDSGVFAPSDPGLHEKVGASVAPGSVEERFRAAMSLLGSIGTRKTVRELAENILDRVLELVEADTAVIMLVSADGNLSPLASRMRESAELRIPSAIVDNVIMNRRGLLTRDAMSDQMLRSSDTIVGQRIRSAMCVPLLDVQNVIGIIHLSSSYAAGAYVDADLEMLQAIAQPAALAVKNARLIETVRQNAEQRAELSRFLPPAVVERALRNGLSIGRQGDRLEATVLFTDIRGFTAMSEGARPEDVVALLNEYFEAMVDVVFSYGGTLDKFIGDGMMAVWGTIDPKPDDAIAAVRAADHMRHVLRTSVNRARMDRGEVPLHIGCGVATGPLVAGAIGAQKRQDFTVIGESVNFSSRLCSMAAGGEIYVCGRTRELCGDALTFEEKPNQVVKGIANPVSVFVL